MHQQNAENKKEKIKVNHITDLTNVCLSKEH